jgi:hypothetical protein
MADQMIELPEPIAAEAAPVSGDDSGINWDDFAGSQGADDNGDDVTVEGDSVVLNVAPPAEVSQPAPTQVPQQETTTIHAESLPTQAALAPAPVTQTPQAVAPSPTAPATAPSSVVPAESAPTLPTVPVTPTLDYGAIEAEQLAQLEKVYGISEEDAQKLQTEPELVLPKLAANMHVAITKSAMAALQSMLPQMLVQHQQMATVEQQARNDFFTANPDLKGHEEAILKVGQMFRAANPTATKDQAVKMIGDMVRMSLGLPLQVQQQQTQQQVSAPATPVQSTPSPAQIMPFTPSRAGGGGAQIQSPTIWDQLISDD